MKSNIHRMNKSTAAIMLMTGWLFLFGCHSPKSEPAEFVSHNRALLDSCSNYMIENMDTLMSCRALEKSTVISIYSVKDMQQCDLIQKNELLQRFLSTEIDFIALYSDSTIVYYYEDADWQNNRPMIIYSRTKSPAELDYDIDCQSTPQHIDGYYFATSDNISLAI